MRASLRRLNLGSQGIQTYFFLAALAALFLSVSEILDYFELPFEALVGHLAASGSLISFGFLTSLVASTGYAGVFVLMTLESASLPIPSEAVLPFAGYLVFRGSMSFWAVVLVSTGAGVAGALADYYLSLKVGRPIVERLFDWCGGGAKGMARAESWLNSNGAWSILLARFVPGVRSSISLPAGALKMRMRTFLTMTLLGSFGWSILLVYLGYSAGNLWRTASGLSTPFLSEAALVVVAVSSAVYLTYFASLRKGRWTPRDDHEGLKCCWEGMATSRCRGGVRPVQFSDSVRGMCFAHFRLVIRIQTMSGAVN